MLTCCSQTEHPYRRGWQACASRVLIAQLGRGRTVTTQPVLEDTRPDLLGWNRGAVADSAAAHSRELAARSAQDLWTSSFYRRYGKRALDLAFGVPLLILATPVIALAALAVLVTSGWPVLYSSKRVGQGGRLFRMWKLRTMVRDADEMLARWSEAHPELAAEYEAAFKLKDDPRITTFGRFLRASSLDELPQLWSVVVGTMSLVGPRPITEPEVRRYGEHAGTLLSLRPGVSGRWQLVEARNAVSYPDRIRMELQYCRSTGLLGDLRILVRTLAAPFRFDGV